MLDLSNRPTRQNCIVAEKSHRSISRGNRANFRAFCDDPGGLREVSLQPAKEPDSGSIH
jgi:hypothetical protein